jgi:hypothetical protein
MPCLDPKFEKCYNKCDNIFGAIRFKKLHQWGARERMCPLLLRGLKAFIWGPYAAFYGMALKW